MLTRIWQDKWFPAILLCVVLVQSLATVYWVGILWDRGTTAKAERMILIDKVKSLEDERYSARDALKAIRENSEFIQWNTHRIDAIQDKLGIRYERFRPEK